jgi:hypothetical protein
MNYMEQYKEIEILLNRIKIKSKNFSVIEMNPYYEDLSYVLYELKEIDAFLNDKYLNSNSKEFSEN